MHGDADARQYRCMAPFRTTLLATICAAIMCCAGAVQLLGINRIVVTDGGVSATLAAASLGGTVALGFKSETFPLER
jgi:hypothetical protein